MYQVYYRKYRPQSFEQLVGQDHIVRTLKNAVIQNKLAHAYLFCGPRGTGKTSLARLFAKSINCTNLIDGVSCNECENCRLLQEQDHPDIIEIDAASNNGVDEIRTLVERVKYAPLKGKYKVYIIDEVHMMTSGAFNALLKTLEEPPAHVIFILATTESNKILPTIISRCQRYDFYKVNVLDSSLRMQEILQKENVSYEKAAINLIANLSDGGLRDALGLLEQIVLYSDSNVDVKSVNEVCGMVSDQDKAILLQTLIVSDVNALLENCRIIQSKSLAIGLLFSDLLSILKDALIYKQLNDDSYATHQIEYITSIANNFTIDQITSIMDDLLQAQTQSGLAIDLNLYFELTLMKLQQKLAVPGSVMPQVTSYQQNTQTSLKQPLNDAQAPSQPTKQYLHPEDEIQEQLKGAITYDATTIDVIDSQELTSQIATEQPKEAGLNHGVSQGTNIDSHVHSEVVALKDELESIPVQNDTLVQPMVEQVIESNVETSHHADQLNVMSLEQIQTFVGHDVVEEVQQQQELEQQHVSHPVAQVHVPTMEHTSSPNSDTETEVATLNTEVAEGQMSLIEPTTEVASVIDFIDEYIASTEEVLNVLVQANRESLQSVKQRWSNTNLYMSHQSLSRIATILCDAIPVAACNNAIIVTFDSQTQANFVNSPKQLTVIQQFLNEILGSETVCIALTEDGWIDCKNEYMKLRQVGKLPKAMPILFAQPVNDAHQTNTGLDFVKRHFDHSIIEEER